MEAAPLFKHQIMKTLPSL